MADLLSKKNDSERAKGWREQLQDVRPLLPADIPAENKTTVEADIREASRGHVEVFTAGKTMPMPAPREINTSGVRDVLREDMKGMSVDILQDAVPVPDANIPMSPGEMKVFETVMDQGFAEGPVTPGENDPVDALIGEIRKKLVLSAARQHENIKNHPDSKKTELLEKAIADLSQRVSDEINGKGKMPDEILLGKLQKLSNEITTVGTAEWERRFLDTGDTRWPLVSKTENPADALERHILDTAIDTIEKKLHTAVVTVEMAFRNNAFDEERMQKFHAAAVDLAERIQKVVDEGNVESLENTLKKLDELSAEIPLVGKEGDSKKIPAVSDTKNDTTEKQAPAPAESANTSPPEEEAPKAERAIPEEETVPVPEEHDESGAENKTSEKEVKIADEIEAQFQKDFALAQEDLKNITTEVGEGAEKKTVRFSDLTQGRQLLLLENLKAFALDNAKEQALKKFTEEEKGKLAEAGFLKKMWLGATKTFRRAHDISATERHLLLNPEESKRMYGEVLSEMLRMAAYAPDAEWKDGKLQINFAAEKDFSGIDFQKPEIAEKLKNFNDAAGNFARVPSEYAYSKDEKQRAQYEEAKKTYADARGELLALKAENGNGNEDEALSYIADMDKKIHFSRLFNANPETETAFAEIIGKKYANFEGLKAFLGERGRLMAGGMAVRTIGMLGAGEIALGFGASVAGAPILAAVGIGAGIGAVSGGILGKYMAEKRARQEIADKKKLGAMGVTNIGNEKDFRAAAETKIITQTESGAEEEIGAGLADKLDYAIVRAEEADAAGDAEKKRQVLKILADRLYYTERKITEGLVSFGEGAAGFKNGYELNLALAKARVLVEMNEPDMERKISVRIEEELKNTPFARVVRTSEAEKIIDMKGKIDALLGGQTKEILEKEEAFKKEKIRQGLKYGIFLGGVFGGGFAGLGAVMHGGESGGNAEAETGAAVALSAKPSLADEVLAKMNPGKIISHEEAAVLPERIPDIGPLPKEVLPASSADIAPANRGGGELPDYLGKNTNPEENVGLKGGAGTQSGVEVLSPRRISIEKSFEELGKPYTVKSGDNVWNIIKTKLGGNENFAKLPPRDQNFIIDSIKDKIMKMSPKELQEIGIKSDPNRIYPGDELKLGTVFNNSEDLAKIFNRAAGSATATEQHVVAPTAGASQPFLPSAAEPAPSLHPSAEEPIIFAQNENIPADVTVPHEVFAPAGDRSEVFVTRTEDIPSYTDYKNMVYDEIHLRHPNLERSLYDTRLKDFLANRQNGLEELRRIFHMKEVATPKILPQETLNGSVLDWWTRQVVQDDFNRHSGRVFASSI